MLLAYFIEMPFFSLSNGILFRVASCIDSELVQLKKNLQCMHITANLRRERTPATESEFQSQARIL